MSKFMNQEEREKAIQELMLSIRRNAKGSKCIDIFEQLLHEVEDTDYVDAIITAMFRYTGDLFRLFKDTETMRYNDFRSKILSEGFLQPCIYFKSVKKQAELHFNMAHIINTIYTAPVYKDVRPKDISTPDITTLGEFHDINIKYGRVQASYYAQIEKKFGTLNDLSIEQYGERMESARKAVLLYNYIPAVIKAIIQTERRHFGLDNNSKRFE